MRQRAGLVSSVERCGEQHNLEHTRQHDAGIDTNRCEIDAQLLILHAHNNSSKHSAQGKGKQRPESMSVGQRATGRQAARTVHETREARWV